MRVILTERGIAKEAVVVYHRLMNYQLVVYGSVDLTVMPLGAEYRKIEWSSERLCEEVLKDFRTDDVLVTSDKELKEAYLLLGGKVVTAITEETLGLPKGRGTSLAIAQFAEDFLKALGHPMEKGYGVLHLFRMTTELRYQRKIRHIGCCLAVYFGYIVHVYSLGESTNSNAWVGYIHHPQVEHSRSKDIAWVNPSDVVVTERPDFASVAIRHGALALNHYGDIYGKREGFDTFDESRFQNALFAMLSGEEDNKRTMVQPDFGVTTFQDKSLMSSDVEETLAKMFGNGKPSKQALDFSSLAVKRSPKMPSFGVATLADNSPTLKQVMDEKLFMKGERVMKVLDERKGAHIKILNPYEVWNAYDHCSQKLRPHILLAHDIKSKQYWAVPITSQKKDGHFDLRIQDFARYGLTKDSYIRVSRFYWLFADQRHRKMGEVSADDMREIDAKLDEYKRCVGNFGAVHSVVR